MRLIISLIVLLVGLTVSPTVLAKREIYPGPYKIDLLHVIDGDTFVARIYLWPGVYAKASIRVAGVDTPESRANLAKCKAELVKGKAVKLWAKKFLPNYLRHLRVRNVKFGKYAGRVVADVEYKVGNKWLNYTKLLITRGYGKKYNGGHKESWCHGR